MPVTDRRALKRQMGLKLAAVPILGPKAMGMFLRRRYGARVVTPTKVANFLLAQRDVRNRAVRVQSLPWIMNIDTSSVCNLKCPFCPTGTDQLERKKTRLPAERAKSIIDLVKHHMLEIRLYNWGEPFLNPDIFEIIRYARDAGLYTIINSNLSVKVPDLARKVVEAGLDRLQASVDGVSQATLERYRRQANAERVFENLKGITEERTRQGVSAPVVELKFLVFRHNEHELDQLEAKRREIGADGFHPHRAFIYHESFIPRHSDYQPLQQMFQDTCDFLYAQLTVEANGAVSPCCTNTSEKWDLGEVDQVGDLREFWNGPVFRAMRAFARGTHDAERLAPGRPILCTTCGLIARAGLTPSRLSPLPPSFQADGISYAHDLDIP